MEVKMETAEQEDKSLGELLEIIRFTEGVSAKLHRVLDEAEIYQVVKEEFAKSDRYMAGILLLADDGASLKLAETSMAPSKLEVLEKASGLRAKEYKIQLKRSSIYSQVVREGKTVQANVSDTVHEFLPRPLAYLISKTMGYDKQSTILAPLHRQGKVIGALAVSSTQLSQHFIPSVESLALHISTALELADEHAQRQGAVQALKRYHDHLGELVEERTTELKAVNEKLREEIAERKQAGEALQEERDKAQRYLDIAGVMLVAIDVNQKVTLINKRGCEVLGYSEEEVISKNWFDTFLPERVRNEVKTVFDKLMAGEIKPVEYFENPILTKSGEQRIIAWHNTVLTGERGKIDGTLSSGEDITERKQAEEALRESREKFQKMFESVTDGISVIDLNGVIIEANQRAVEMHGFASRDELLGRNASELIAPRDRQRIAANMRRAVKEGAIRGAEYTLLKADGTEFPGELSTNVVRDASGKVVAHITIARDITERKGMEETLRESEERFRSIVENSQAGIMILDDAYRFVYVNDELCRMSGYSRDELIGQDFRQFLDEESKGFVAKRYIQRQRGEEVPPRYEFNIIKKDGQKRRVEISSAVIKDSAGEVKTVAQLLDITERKQTEEALQAEKNKLQSLVDAMEDDLTIQDRDYNIIYQNEPSRISSGGDHVGEKCYQVYEGKEQVCDGCPVEQAFKDGKSHTAERKTVAPSGETIFWETTANPIRDASGEIVSCLEVGRNITGRKRAEEALRESQKFSSSLLASSPNPITVVNLDTSIRYVNPAFEKLTGFTLDEIAGRKAPYPWWPEGKRARILAGFKDAIEHGGRRTERNFQKKNGERFWVALNSASVIHEGKPVYLILNWLDITERKRAEEKEKQLQQELYLAQRLASVGELAAGVAHEINNPLTGVLGFSQQLMRKSTDEKVGRDLKIIHGEARRAAEVVQNLLTFARRRQPKKEYVNINDIVQKTLELRSYALQTSNIEVVTTLASSLPQIMVDFPQMQEVFLNIILNAEQAMSEARVRGKLIIKTRRIKDHVRVSFADDGPGISPKNLNKVFDPFFTTREGKGGTGLGLSACHGIVTEHGGRIYVRSKVGEGATFFVELPLSLVETALAH